jgi:hypothetical protein
MPEEQSKFSGVLAKLKRRPAQPSAVLPAPPLEGEPMRGEDGHTASAVTLTISQQRCCCANTPRKQRHGCWKIRTLGKTSQI